jgi:hypothetical protein
LVHIVKLFDDYPITIFPTHSSLLEFGCKGTTLYLLGHGQLHATPEQDEAVERGGLVLASR